jgi:hypothetical protein
MAPVPKPPGQQRRPHRGPAPRELPAEGRQGRPPVLPRKRPPWLKSTRDWWERAWRSPSAAAWIAADLDVMLRLAHIREAIGRGEGGASLHAAATQLEDRLGLSPRARRALGWEVSPGRDEPEQPEAPRSRREMRGRVVALRRRLDDA